MKKTFDLHCHINQTEIKKTVDEGYTVADFLHEDLNLTGTKLCCGMGICKACTFALKKPGEDKFSRAQACITPISELQGATLITVEGLNKVTVQNKEGSLHPLQKAFLKHFAFQCGYSAPGFLMGSYVLLEELKKHPCKKEELDQKIIEAVGENLCRCTGYVKYFAAIREVLQKELF